MAVTDKELDSDLAELATRVEKMRVKYQGFFLGLEKLPPLFERDQLERFIRVSPLNDAHRAVHKFRFQALLQRYRTLAVYWDRIMRELEEGKVTRESMRRDAGYASGAPRETAPVDDDGPSAGKPATRAPAAPVPAPVTAPVPAADDPLKRLYVDYISARSSLGLANEGITESAFRTSLDKQRQAQAEKLGVPSISFSVVVKEGRVILLARPGPA
jgi:hypothetical protein